MPGGEDVAVDAEGRLYTGDLAEAFPREESLIFALDTVEEAAAPYALRSGGCGADYTVVAANTLVC